MTVSPRISEKLRSFRDFDWFPQLCQAIVSERKQLGIHGKGPSSDEPLDLSKVTAAIRGTHESLISSATGPVQADDLHPFYGPSRFKCPRVNCIGFYDSYVTKPERDRHLEKHERPYTCGIPDCPMAIIGYSTEKALQKHLIELHGLDPGTNVDFPMPPKATTKKTAEKIFRCSICPRTFTRAFNRTCHMRAHTNSKPFACKTCGKLFARQTDCRRHEASHKVKTFICTWPLKNGASCGCGGAFARKDKLQAHLESLSGRRCIALFRAEQESGPEPVTLDTTIPLEATTSEMRDVSQSDVEMTEAQWDVLLKSCVHEYDDDEMTEPEQRQFDIPSVFEPADQDGNDGGGPIA